MTGYRQVISHISKDSQNILIYNFIITSSDCQGGGQDEGVNALARPGTPWCGTPTETPSESKHIGPSCYNVLNTIILSWFEIKLIGSIQIMGNAIFRAKSEWTAFLRVIVHETTPIPATMSQRETWWRLG